MKKLKLWQKIVLIVSLVTLLMTSVVTASADVIDPTLGPVLTNITPVDYIGVEFRGTNSGSPEPEYGYFSNSAVVPDANGDYTFPVSRYVYDMASGDLEKFNITYAYDESANAVNTHIVSNAFNNTVDGEPDVSHIVRSVSVYFDDFIYNRNLPSSSYSVGSRISDDYTIFDNVSILYFGNVVYPLKEGGFREIHYDIANLNGTYDKGDFRRALAIPSYMHVNGNPIEKIDMYRYVYDNASDNSDLISPDKLSSAPIYLTNSGLYMSWDVVNIVDFALKSQNEVVFTDYLTYNNTPREGESYADWASYLIGTPLVDFEDLDMFSWLDKSLSGFLELEFAPGLSILSILSIVLGLGLFKLFLKYFAGG